MFVCFLSFSQENDFKMKILNLFFISAHCCLAQMLYIFFSKGACHFQVNHKDLDSQVCLIRVGTEPMKADLQKQTFA